MSRPSFVKAKILWPLQAGVTHALFWGVRCLPLDVASDIGGKIARLIGPRLPVTKVAQENLKKALPELSPAERDCIVLDMWENLGRTAFEYPHLSKINVYEHPDRFEILNTDYLEDLKGEGKGAIFFTAHMANWEAGSRCVSQYFTTRPLNIVYREPDNPHMRTLFARRQADATIKLIPKGASGARQALEVMKDNGLLAMLIDQKMNDGIKVPFFGMDAMTAPAIAQFALKYGCCVVPLQIERRKGATFRLTFHPPVQFHRQSDRKSDLRRVMVALNAQIESWIRQNPSQWLWLHRRWPS